MWNWIKDNYNQISVITQVFMAFSTFLGLASWPKFRDLLKKLWNKFKSFITSILNWIREKIVGKENLELLEKLKDTKSLELLKELEVLRGNKWAIDFLNRLRETDEAKIKIGYEALNAFIILYSDAADRVSPVYLCKFEDAYEEDKKYNVDDYRNFSKVYKLREEILEKLIKKYSK